MDEFYFSANLDNNRILCLAPLTNRRIALSRQEIIDPSGYFLYEMSDVGELADIDIKAQVFTEEAVLQLRALFNMD